MIDLSTEFGSRVARRLREDLVIWLVTVDSKLTPQPTPVWFLWGGASFLIYSQPNTAKLRNIAQHPNVALHLDGDEAGDNIFVFAGEARVDAEAPLADKVDAYVEKYRVGLEHLKLTAAQFAQEYSVALRVTPARLRGH